MIDSQDQNLIDNDYKYNKLECKKVCMNMDQKLWTIDDCIQFYSLWDKFYREVSSYWDDADD